MFVGCTHVYFSKLSLKSMVVEGSVEGLILVSVVTFVTLLFPLLLDRVRTVPRQGRPPSIVYHPMYICRSVFSTVALRGDGLSTVVIRTTLRSWCLAAGRPLSHTEVLGTRSFLGEVALVKRQPQWECPHHVYKW